MLQYGVEYLLVLYNGSTNKSFIHTLDDDLYKNTAVDAIYTNFISPETFVFTIGNKDIEVKLQNIKGIFENDIIEKLIKSEIVKSTTAHNRLTKDQHDMTIEDLAERSRIDAKKRRELNRLISEQNKMNIEDRFARKIEDDEKAKIKAEKQRKRDQKIKEHKMSFVRPIVEATINKIQESFPELTAEELPDLTNVKHVADLSKETEEMFYDERTRDFIPIYKKMKSMDIYKLDNITVKRIYCFPYYKNLPFVLRHLNNEIINYRAISVLCPEYFCRFIGYKYNRDSMYIDIVMENCGEDLITHAEQRKISHPDWFRIFIKMINTVKCLHENNYVHFDIKPDNIVAIKNEGNFTVKFIDAGTLTHITDNPEIVDSMGTIKYMHPDVYRSKQLRTSKKMFEYDVYSLLISFLMLSKFTKIDSLIIKEGGKPESFQDFINQLSENMLKGIFEHITTFKLLSDLSDIFELNIESVVKSGGKSRKSRRSRRGKKSRRV